jgi:hypothetical protein
MLACRKSRDPAANGYLTRSLAYLRMSELRTTHLCARLLGEPGVA